jgi:putative tryptophan/tyrosine transport system substrate-binding protein
MRRRDFVALLGTTAAASLAWPLSGRAQQAARPPLIGVLSPISAATAVRNIEAFRTGLHDLGYVEGRDFTIELRFGDGAIERLPDLAAELVALKPAVIVAGSPPAALAARNATRTIPIVMNSSENPMVLGLATGLARPGGNVTGFWWGDEGLIGKQLELIKEAVPGTARVAILVNPDDRNSTESMKSLPEVTRVLGFEARVIEVHAAGDFQAAFATVERENLQALQCGISPLFVSHRAEVTALATHAHLPAVYGIREFATAGGLMSYGTSLPDIYRGKARLVDKILKGTSPAEVPIERATKFELVINLKAAKALGLTIPESVLLRADELIE